MNENFSPRRRGTYTINAEDTSLGAVARSHSYFTKVIGFMALCLKDLYWIRNGYIFYPVLFEWVKIGMEIDPFALKAWFAPYIPFQNKVRKARNAAMFLLG
jgi:hypothetical protein